MIKINPPNFSVKKVLDVCFGSDNQKKTQETKKRMRVLVEDFSDLYDKLAPVNEFHELIKYHVLLNNLVLDEQELKYVSQLYNYRFTREKSGRVLYDYMIDEISDECPYCFFGEISQIDHFIPQTAYCIWNIHPTNLIPICANCNKNKDDYVGESSGKNLLHPYYDDFSRGQWLFAEIQIIHGRIKYKVNYRCEPTSVFTSLEAERLKNNFDTLKLAQRFQRIAKSQSKTIKSELVGILGNKDDSARRNYLKRLIRSKKATYGSNYWLVALYQAFLNYSGDLDDLK